MILCFESIPGVNYATPCAVKVYLYFLYEVVLFRTTQSNACQIQIVRRSNNVQYFVESKQKEAPIKLASATR